VPGAGDIWLDEVALTQLGERDRTLFRRDHIGFVFQFFNLIPTLDVLENVMLVPELRGLPRAATRQRALEQLRRVGLGDRAQSMPDRLSGGEQQRVAIARALIGDPALVLADEPTGNLDADTGQSVMNLLLELTRQAGKTLIMATHSLDVVPLADEVYAFANHQLELTAP
jgi:putative ABC transport system ATP-binding protein